MNARILLLLTLSTTSSMAADLVSRDPISADDCPLLTESVSIRLSTGVSGAWNCDETTQNIKVATCSRVGSRRPLTVQCLPISSLADGTDRFNASECAAARGEVELNGAKGFVASSSFPASVMIELGADCSDDTIVAIDFLAD